MLRKLWTHFVMSVARSAGFAQKRAHHFYPKILNESSFVIDLGAHKGEFSRFVSDNFKCSVLGLEANPQLFTNLPDLPKTKFLNFAINQTDAPVVFNVSNNLEASSVFEKVAEATGRLSKVTVPGITLDSLLTANSLQKIDLLKVDIESAEFQMLEMASAEAIRRVTQITVEFHVIKDSGEFTATRVIQICRRLEKLGLTCFIMDRDYTDVLFLNTSAIPWRLSERIAMHVYRHIITPLRKIRLG